MSERPQGTAQDAPRKAKPAPAWHPWRARLLAIAVVSALAMVAAGAAFSCSTTTIQQGNYNVAGYTWLQAYYNREYDDNNAFINQNWSVCEKLIAPNSSPEFRYSYKCATNGFAYGFSNDLGRAPYPNCNTIMSALMLNNQASSATFDFYQHY